MKSSPLARASATTTGNRVPLDIEMGDRILYKKYTGQEIQIDNEDLIVLEEREVLAKLIV